MILDRFKVEGQVAVVAGAGRGEPMLRLDLRHRGEHGDHNVSGMIVTSRRLVNAVRAVCAAPAGLVFAKDLPMVFGRGLVASQH